MSDMPQHDHLCLDILSGRGCINLRGGAEILPIVAQHLGQELPRTANTMSFGNYTIYWLGPDEWLIFTNENDASSITRSLLDALNGAHASITDVSGGQIVLQLKGSAARSVLSKGCTLDFGPSAGFVRGVCAQSGLAKSNVLLGCIDEPSCFEIIVRRSFSEYLMLWLNRAGAEYGLKTNRNQ